MSKFYIDYKKTASIDVDCQNGFSENCPDELPVNGALSIVPEIIKTHKYVVYKVASKDAHSEKATWVANNEQPQFSPIKNEKNLDIRWNKHCNVGEYGFELLDGLPKISEYDFLIYKGVEKNIHPYSAVYHDLAKKISTGVIEFLMSKNVNQVIVNGLALDFCVKETVLDLVNSGFIVFLNLAGTKAVHPKSAKEALEIMKKAGVIFVDSADDFILM